MIIEHSGKVRLRSRNTGTTLIVVLVLVLLATLLALFALNVGVFSQRASASDVRARLVRQATESGLAQGVEYFRNNRSGFQDPTSSANWELCAADDNTYPCGAVPRCAPEVNYTDPEGNVFKSDGNTTCNDLSRRRGNMYRYIGGAGYDVNGNGSTTDTMDTRSLPINSQMTVMSSAGNSFNVNYGVGGLICMVKTPADSTDPTVCTTDVNQASSVRILTLTAVGSIPDENASTTISSAYGVHSTLYSPTNKPPVVASGSVGITGGIQVVTNPDAAGNGVPVSVWTRQDVQKTGTPNTCYFDDFLRGQKTSASIQFEPNSDGSTSQVITCDTCECSNSLSYQSSGNAQDMGIDILDVDSVPVIGTAACTTALAAGSYCKSNVNVQLPNSTTGVYEFPCDMFQYVFGVRAWEDDELKDGSAGQDGFCETRMYTTTDFTPADGSALPAGGIGIDEAYLYNNATQIIPGTLHPSGWIDPSKLATCGALADSSTSSKAQGGMIWVQYGANCSFPSTLQIGTPDLPVVLVVDGNMTGGQVYHSRMFGLLFVRAPDSPLDATTGGSSDGNGASLYMNAGSVIYGSLVIQGQFLKGNGTASVVYNKTVLEHLGNQPGLNPFAPVPASWTDRYAY